MRRRRPTAEADADAAFERYVIPEVEVLLRVATSMTRNRADAEDLVQETLLRSYRAIERFDGRHPRAWLLTIMRNAEINRHRRRRPELLDDPDEVDRRAVADTDEASSPEAAIVDPVFDEAVERAYRSLSEPFRSVVEAVDLNGLTYQETADLLDIKIGTVMSRLHRARRRIRESLAAEGLAPAAPGGDEEDR